MEAVAEKRPIRLVVRDDDLGRNRLTVFFRLLLAIPHLIWVALWGIAAFLVAIVLWLAILINGKAPTGLHDFVAGYLRYATQLGAYLYLAANPYPGFRGRPGYDVDLEIEAPMRQSRWSAGFRLLLALPALFLAASLGGGIAMGSPGGSWSTTTGEGEWAASGGATALGVAAACAFLLWFVSVVRGRAARGLRDLVTYSIGYAAQTGGYLLLLTDRYPSTDPALAETFAELPEHPVRIVVADDLERPRLTVAFRLLLAIPHLVWIVLWAIAVFFAVIAAWVVALVTGRVPSALHRFLTAFVRYATHLGAFLYLVGRRFPGFTGRAGSYGIDLEMPEPERQSRWKTLFRLFLALPALVVASALGTVLLVLAVIAWFFALVTGRMPEGLRNLGAACLRYSAQTDAYLLLLTDRYPYASPVLRPRAQVPEPAAAPAGEPL